MEHQEFNGIRFSRTSEKDYFRSTTNGTTILMHRYVWEYYNCKIPKGYHVHHIDGNKANNDISNLQLLKGADHWALHSKLLTEEEREWKRQNIISSAVPKAKEWHRSEDGKEWHRQQYLKTKDALHQKVDRTCKCCGKSFLGTYTSKFCSSVCKSRFARDTNKNKEERTCIICGATFLTDKYKNSKCCSPKCRAILSHRK